ncbi:MAG TPA: DUF1922 domain-containing protein [Methanocorpusculum sp.]|nr:DUF1922 domain-containing protein [Methanocorpusculum sp.]
MNGFAVIGCPKCRRKMVADLAYDTKTCQCGNKINLKKTRFLALADTAAEAGDILRALNSTQNTGFTSAQDL